MMLLEDTIAVTALVGEGESPEVDSVILPEYVPAIREGVGLTKIVVVETVPALGVKVIWVGVVVDPNQLL